MVVERKQLHLPVREAKRKKMAPQTMAITAVHEAGHALVYAVVFGRLPKMVTIASSDHFSGGYVEGESLLDFDTYELVRRRTVVRMAGKKAEELVFGTDHQITFGCISDLSSATRMLMNVVRSGVLPEVDKVFEHTVHGSGKYLPESSEELKWVEEQLEKSSELASQILKEHEGAYKKLVEILLKRISLKSGELAEAWINEGVNVHELLNYFPSLPDYTSKLENYLGKLKS